MRCPASASWPRFWAWSSPWAPSEVRLKKSATKSQPRWSARSSAFCSATGSWAPSPPTWPRLAEDEHAYHYVLRVLMVAFLKGTPPIMAVEVARRAIPGHVGPSFQEVEQACRGGGCCCRAAAAASSLERVSWRKPVPSSSSRRKGGHGGHHGGAWKVAYADFVTAMMALFIVLWLLNSSKQVQEAVGGYFKDPTGTSKKVGSNMAGSGENFTLTKDNMPKLKEQLQKSIHQIANFDKLKNQIEMTVTAEGLRIELLESENGTFFDSGSPHPTSAGMELA